MQIAIRHIRSEAYEYEALTYMWGDESKKRGIMVDGKEFLAGVLLLGALQDLQDTVSERVFWIDAICINQRDISERVSEVANFPSRPVT